MSIGLSVSVKLPCCEKLFDRRRLGSHTDLDARWDCCACAGLRPGRNGILVHQVLEIASAGLEAGCVRICEVVGDHVHVGLLGSHSCRRRPKASHSHLAPSGRYRSPINAK